MFKKDKEENPLIVEFMQEVIQKWITDKKWIMPIEEKQEEKQPTNEHK